MSQEKPHFVYDPDMTLAERLEARREQLQNLREQAELEERLKKDYSFLAKPGNKVNSEEEKLDKLRRQKKELEEKEVQIGKELQELENIEKDFYHHRKEASEILEDLFYAFPSEGNVWSSFYQEDFEENKRLQSKLEDYREHLLREQRQVRDKQEDLQEEIKKETNHEH